MDYTTRLAISYYKTIAVLDEEHKVYLVQHMESGIIGVKKMISVYNREIYRYLKENPISGIPSILELHEEENCLVVIEEYIAGRSLMDIMKNPLEVSLIEKYIMGLCDILIRLHSVNPPIVHRDIKPSNIIINSFGQVVLIDFNAAKYYVESENADTVLLGTQGYAAPEQYGFGSSSPQTDIYSVGILLKEMTDTLPEKQKKRFERIINKCIRMDPKSRYASALQLKNAFSSEREGRGGRRNIWFLPPGFRTLKIWKMLLASFGYFFIGWFSLTLEVENTYGVELWLQRLLPLGVGLFLIFFSFDYGGIQKGVPLCNSSKRWVHYLGIALWDILFFFVIVGIALFLIVILFEM